MTYIDTVANMSPRRLVKVAQDHLDRVSEHIDSDTYSFLSAYNRRQWCLADAISKHRERRLKNNAGGVARDREEDVQHEQEPLFAETLRETVKSATEARIRGLNVSIENFLWAMEAQVPLCNRNVVDERVKAEAILRRCLEINIHPVRTIDELRAVGGVLSTETDEDFYHKYLLQDNAECLSRYRAMLESVHAMNREIRRLEERLILLQ